MSEMTRAVIQMPYDMAMDGEISRLQFYNRAQTLLADFDTLAQRLQEAERVNAQLLEERDRLAGLLRECRSEFETSEASGFEVEMRQRIDAELAEVKP